jgi:inner membrane protein
MRVVGCRMDNICHTLAGATLARAGLDRRTPLAGATLMIAANFPDIDVVAVPLGHSVDFRRGWTHGVLALAVLPFVLTAMVIAWDRWRRRPQGLEPVRAPAVLRLAFLGMLTHPTLDWMNEYGLRWLMPFDGTWFYGDSLFIVDPWLWAVLGLGVWLTRRRVRIADDDRARAPARAAVALAAAYMMAMVSISSYAEQSGRAELRQAGITAEEPVKFSASFANPNAWRVLLRTADEYRGGTLTLFPVRRLHLPLAVPIGEVEPAAVAAAATEEGRRFLSWSRFPFYLVQALQDGSAAVTIADLRYTPPDGPRAGRGWASVSVVVPVIEDGSLR